MNNHSKKLVAPTIISILLLIYFICYGVAIFFEILRVSVFVGTLLLLIPVGFAGVVIYVYIERLKEIRSGEEDDLSKY